MKFLDWEKEMLALTVLYRMAECGDRPDMITSGSKWAPLDDILQTMFNADLIKPSKDDQYWEVDAQGTKLLTRMCGMIDAALKFAIFKNYNFDQAIEDDWWDEEGTQLQKHIWDPRFDPDTEGNKEDLRIAMMTWMAEKLKRAGKLEGVLDPRKVVYLRHLANGVYSDSTDDFLHPANIKKRFDDVNEIVEAAYAWTDLGDDEKESFELASVIYTAGMLQVRKEEGPSCGAPECGAPLALFGNDLDECPICKADFSPPEPEGEEMECPNCKRTVGDEDYSCPGCGAVLDYGLPEGTVETSTQTTTETVTEDYYEEYVPWGWYDPYDPIADAIAFGVICAVVF